MKLLYLILPLIFLQCQTKYAIYKRDGIGLHEQFDINLKNNLFFYHADSSGLSYNANGKFNFAFSGLLLEFPENAESTLLSPFKKGYAELVKTDESDQIEINVTNFDVRSKTKLTPNRHFHFKFDVLAALDSSLVRKVEYPSIDFEETGKPVLLRSKVEGYFDQFILISGKGRYTLNIYLQPRQTLVWYETTSVECYEVVTGPLLQLRASGIENNLNKYLFVESESYVPYPLAENPYTIVGIEKRKLKLIQ